MNNYTKNDLSAGEVKLDYKALTDTAAYAVGTLKEKLNEYLSDLFNVPLKSSAHQYLTAQYIAETAQKLAVAVDTYCALTEGLERERKEIINITK